MPLYYAHDPVQAIERSGESSRTTHGAQDAVDACRYFGGLIVSAVDGADKDNLLAPKHSPVPGYWEQHPLDPAVETVAAGSFKKKEPPKIQGTGYVVDALEAALWAFHKSYSFKEGLLLAINLGDDADTTGAIYGQLAGAYYGFRWTSRRSYVPRTRGPSRGASQARLLLLWRATRASSQQSPCGRLHGAFYREMGHGRGSPCRDIPP